MMQAVAYWQWSLSFITRYYAQPRCQSIVEQSDTVTGYPEFYYFQQTKLLPTIRRFPALMKQFGEVQMYVSDKDKDVKNFENIFDLQGPNGTGDPGPGSIFNITTLQHLLKISDKQFDILYQPWRFKSTIDLSQYQKVTDLLGFK